MEHIHAFVADVCSTNSLSMVKGDAARIAVAIGGIRDPSAVLDVARPMVERRREAGRVLRQAMADAGLPGGAEAEIQAITKDYGNREPPTADNAATIMSAIIARLKGRREAVERIALLRPLADEAKLILPDSALEASGIGELMASGGWESALAALRAEHDGAVRSRLGAQGVNSFSDLASMANNGNARAVGLVMLGAAGFKGEIQQAADIVARGLGAGDAKSQEFAAAIGALGARIRADAEAADRASRERQAAMRWRSSLLTQASICSRLEASLAEVQRWIGDGRLPVAARDHVGSGGQELTLHDPAHVRLAKGEVQAWRAEWADGLRARRREAAQRDDAVLRRRRLAVVRSAVPGAAMSGDHVLAPLGPLGSDICGAPATVELGGTSPVRLPWPGNMAVADGQGEALRGGARKEAVQALRKEIGTVVGAVRAELGEVLHNWNHQATAVMREYPVEEQPEFASRLRHALRTAASTTGCSPSLPDAVTRMLARALSAAVTQHAKEQKHGSLRRASGLSDYAALFPAARAIRRRLILHVGPTNSGKTHDAMERLAAAETGCYLAPLRLMAIEAAERLNGRGVPTDMVTGEERLLVDGARHVAATVEMADLDKPVCVAVIDEIQMLADRDRGWAWTQAAVGAAAAEVVMTGSIDALPHVVRIAEMTGDELEVITYERKVPLEAVRHRWRSGRSRKGTPSWRSPVARCCVSGRSLADACQSPSSTALSVPRSGATRPGGSVMGRPRS